MPVISFEDYSLFAHIGASCPPQGELVFGGGKTQAQPKAHLRPNDLNDLTAFLIARVRLAVDS